MNALDSINQIYTGACFLTNFQALWFLTQMGVSVNWIILVIITVITTVITFYERCACDKDLVFRITRYIAMFMKEAYYNCVQQSFHVISLSETKIKSNCDLTSNIAIEGYDFVPKSTLTNAVDVWFFIRGDSISYLRWSLFNDKSLNLYGLRLIMIHIKIFCALSYIYSGKTEDFNKYLFSTLEKLSKTKKLCLFKGDFNIINLLNFEDSDNRNSLIMWFLMASYHTFCSLQESLITYFL